MDQRTMTCLANPALRDGRWSEAPFLRNYFGSAIARTASLRLNDGRLVVNPGSVGLPAYDAPEPFPHRMEAGTPHARYAIAEREADGWRVEFLAIDYDWTAAAAMCRAHGWLEWGRILETGRV
jgi:hypothetical protein